ncbi:MAG: GIY-YIG nuclease family protein [Roseomonas sp.]|nr:GIY-YIG nuclease family protein [Roseomonas sp.]
MKPRSINIFLLDGDPDGVKVAQIAMSTIHAIAFRRNQLRRVRDTFPEIERPGVYVLIGADETEPGRLLGYIGESEGVGGRLATHSADSARNFWTDTVVLVSKDENLTKSHARYVEASLIRAVGDNPRWTLPNTNRPSSDAGKLPLPDRVAMDEFIDQTKTLVGALGWDLFKVLRGPVTPAAQAAEAPPAPSPAAAERFSFRGEGFDAEMKIGPSGEIIVTGGSKARLRTTPTIPKGTVAMRQMLQDRGVLKPSQEHLVFEGEYVFSSPSAAAAVVTGASANGRVVWKLPDGRTYADWEDCQNQKAGGSSAAPEA